MANDVKLKFSGSSHLLGTNFCAKHRERLRGHGLEPPKMLIWNDPLARERN